MGMAASQARLLSITTRLTNNEFRSQMVANSKTRLANETQAASDEYMEALNATKLQYVYYDANGQQTLYDLTASTMLQYQPLKNQYALVNRAGQTMVNHGDATTFQQANNLDEFLVLNNCLKIDEWTEHNPAYDNWKASEPKDTDPDYWETVVSESSDLYEKFAYGTASGCWSSVMAGNAALFHLGDVLSHLLDLGTYTTSDGLHTFTISDGPSQPFYHWWNGVGGGSGGVNGDPVVMAEIRAELKDRHCCGQHEDEYHQDCDGDELFTQKVVDLLWASQNPADSGMTEEEILNKAKHLVFYDLKYALNETEEFLEEKFKADHAEWVASEPPETLDFSEREILDPDKAEWYTNLWYRMNGAVFDEEHMQNANDEGYNNADDFHQKYFEKTADADQSWVEFDETLINSPEWLQFALETGEITLEKVVFNEDYDTTTELENKTWTATSWSSTADIVEVTDELAITKAEVKYNQALRDIQAKDKEYDNDIKKLDTEHNALQTEYDSIKGVLDKNMERSFKAFS